MPLRAASNAIVLSALTAACLLAPAQWVGAGEMPQGFVYLRDVDPTIQQDMRYAGAANFVGHVVPGYDAAECVLVTQAANGLKAVQAELKEKQLSLKVYGCYRPARGRGLRRLGERARRPASESNLLSAADQARTVPGLYRHALGSFARRHHGSHAGPADSGRASRVAASNGRALHRA